MVAEVPVKGVFEENCYFFIDDRTKHGFVIDPGAQGEGLLRLIRKEGWTIEKILLTHGHFDHTGAVDLLRKELGIPVLAHSRSREYLLDPRMNLSVFCGPPLVIKETASFDEGDVIMLSAAPAISLRVLYTPDIPPIQLSYILLRNALHLSGIRSSKEASVIPDILVEKGAICSEA